jgi:D-xylonolactonase
MASEFKAQDSKHSVELIADYACETGENPLWHALEHKLYWTDIPKGRLFRYDPATETHEQCYTGRPVGGFTVQQDGALLLFLDRGTVALWRDGRLTEVIPEVAAEIDSRFNDVIADPRGRVFCGTMATADRKGRLWRLDPDRSLHMVLEGIGCANGMAFTPDRRGLYFTDSFAREVYLFDYCADDGTLSNQRVFARFSETDGWPDGATLDAEGRLWCAFWDGSCLARLNEKGEIEQKFTLPVPKVSSLTFGGENYDEIYITTAGGHQKEFDGPAAGALFRLRGKWCGVPEFQSAIETQR